MFFDDRLATVLRQETASDIAKRTQFRQLLDILGNQKFGPAGRRDQSLVAAAWLRMDALGRTIPAAERAAMIREPSWRFRSADLAAHLCDFEPEVTSATLNRVELSAEDWTALIPRLPIRARGFLRLRRDLPVDVEQLLDRLGVQDRGLPSPGPSEIDAAVPTSDPVEETTEKPLDLEIDAEVAASSPAIEELKPHIPDPLEAERSEISALVERIAQFTRTREGSESGDLTDTERSPRLPLGEVEPGEQKLATTFAFSADTAGRIVWAEVEVAPMVIGARLISRRVMGDSHSESPLERAFLARQPILQTPTTLNGAAPIAGDWIVDAEPRFAYDGHFTGYIGRFRRPATVVDDEATQRAREADRIRQLLHELRTPVTAVQGYAEVIQQQLFGPAPHEYRALAAAIAADAAHILAGFEEMDRLSRLEIGTIGLEAGVSDLAALVRQIEAQLTKVLTPRMAGLSLDIRADEPVPVPIGAEEAELIVWRFLATLAGGCSAGETLGVELVAHEGAVNLTCDLPRQLLEEEDIFSAENQPVTSVINAGLFGAGFSLRLARAEAQSVGGGLVEDDGRLVLRLPLVVAEPAEPALTPA
jgi:two-component system OmpR family sensor kinase